MFQSSVVSVDDFHSNIGNAKQVSVQPWAKYASESTINPNERSLIVLQVNDFALTIQYSRLNDHVQLVIDKPRVTLADNPKARLSEQREYEVLARLAQAKKFAVVKLVSSIVAADIDLPKHYSLALVETAR